MNLTCSVRSGKGRLAPYCQPAGFLLALALTANGAEELTATTAAGTELPPAPRSVSLEYREVGYSVMNWGLGITSQSTPFAKEPGFGQGKIARGTFFSRNQEQAISFAWDQTRGKLYLDLNRNRDLTDDGAGVFSCGEHQQRSNFQSFTNIHLTFPTPNGPGRALVDIALYSFGQVDGRAELRSLWQGRVSLQGRDYEVGLIENLSQPGTLEDSYLLLRRWESRDEPFVIGSGSLEAFVLPESMFLGKRAYQLRRVFERPEQMRHPKLEFTERSVELGDLQITGKFIRRALLTRSNLTAVLNTPDAVVKVPVGAYNRVQVSLRQGGMEAYRQADAYGGGTRGQVVVKASSPATLTAGGPLTNTVTAARQGKLLNLSYQLVGADGEAFQLQGARAQPEFAVYRANKQIASGKFEFG